VPPSPVRMPPTTHPQHNLSPPACCRCPASPFHLTIIARRRALSSCLARAPHHALHAAASSFCRANSAAFASVDLEADPVFVHLSRIARGRAMIPSNQQSQDAGTCHVPGVRLLCLCTRMECLCRCLVAMRENMGQKGGRGIFARIASMLCLHVLHPCLPCSACIYSIRACHALLAFTASVLAMLCLHLQHPCLPCSACIYSSIRACHALLAFTAASVLAMLCLHLQHPCLLCVAPGRIEPCRRALRGGRAAQARQAWALLAFF
jgi:hypothetical protein